MRKHPNLVVQPKELNCALDVARQLIYDLLVSSLLILLREFGLQLD